MRANSGETTTRAECLHGGIGINCGRMLPAGDGKLSAYEYLPWDKPDFERDPYPWYARAQAEVPVLRDDTGSFVVSRYDDIMEFGKHPTMSVEPGWDLAGPWSVARETVIGRDVPEHTRLRRQTNKWFTPKIVREWVATTKAVTNEVIDGMRSDTLDGWHDLSLLPTHRTMCRVLQVPDHDAEGVMAEMAATMPMLSALRRPGTLEMAEAGFAKLNDRVVPLIEAKRTVPGDGLVDALLSAQSRGEISEREMQATILMLYGLGHMDVGYIVAAGLSILAQLPDVYDAFRSRPELRDAIVNEIVRYDPPELSFYRVTTADVTIRGTDIPAGSTIRYLLAAANRDPEIFTDAQRFDYTRPTEQSRNLSFGMGVHSCVGQVISRAEARAVFEVVASRFRRIELAESPEMDNTDFSRHFTKLTLRLTP
ncbi:cytochrome P450 [Mycolicibacterium sp.]|uniref:cytochrome P450 n=1 Tax=Mycolicibacterium sp. TaxID=2320850 RepID=UPI0037C6E35A